MLNAFLDEAGTHDAGVCVTVAGFYGSDEQWISFRNLWKPLAKGFHALNCEERYADLCAAIQASQIHGIFATLWKADYNALATEHMKSFMGNPYAICAFMCVMSICQEANTATSFVLEQGQPNLRFVQRILQHMMDSGELCIAAVKTAKKTDFIELHPADFVSHCASSYEKPWLQKLFDAGLLKHGHVGKEQLRNVAPFASVLVKKAKDQRLKAKDTDAH